MLVRVDHPLPCSTTEFIPRPKHKSYPRHMLSRDLSEISEALSFQVEMGTLYYLMEAATNLILLKILGT